MLITLMSFNSIDLLDLHAGVDSKELDLHAPLKKRTQSKLLQLHATYRHK